jgi:hypothetical protein
VLWGALPDERQFAVTHGHNLLSRLRLLGCLSVAFYGSQGNGGFILATVMKLKLSCDRRSVGQSVLVSGSHLELSFLSDNCGFLDVEHPL